MAMRPVPGAVATGLQRNPTRVCGHHNPVAIAPGTDYTSTGKPVRSDSLIANVARVVVARS